MAAVERFDIEKVTQVFQDSLHEEDDITMDEYLKGYEEINKYVQSHKRTYAASYKDFSIFCSDDSQIFSIRFFF